MSGFPSTLNIRLAETVHHTLTGVRIAITLSYAF